MTFYVPPCFRCPLEWPYFFFKGCNLLSGDQASLHHFSFSFHPLGLIRPITYSPFAHSVAQFSWVILSLKFTNIQQYCLAMLKMENRKWCHHYLSTDNESLPLSFHIAPQPDFPARLSYQYFSGFFSSRPVRAVTASIWCLHNGHLHTKHCTFTWRYTISLQPSTMKNEHIPDVSHTFNFSDFYIKGLRCKLPGEKNDETCVHLTLAYDVKKYYFTSKIPWSYRHVYLMQ